MTDIRQFVTDIITELHPGMSPENMRGLVTDGILDSFDIVTMITDFKDRLGVTITADKIVPEHFDSLDDICTLIEEMMKGT